MRKEYYYNEEGFYEEDDISELAFYKGVLYKGDCINPYKIAHALHHIPLWEATLIIHPDCEEIEDDAFYDCDPHNIRIPGSVKRIGKRAFQHNRSEYLKKIIIKEGTEYIDEEAFYGCYYVARIELPSTIKELGKDCFTDIGYLLRIIYNGTKKQWNLIKKDRNWISGEYHFNLICKDGKVRYDRTERYQRYDRSDDKITFEFVKDSLLEVINGERSDNIKRARSYYQGLSAYLANVEKLDANTIDSFFIGLTRLFVETHRGSLETIHQIYLEVTGPHIINFSYKRFYFAMTSVAYNKYKQYALDLVTTTLPRYRRFYVVMIGATLINDGNKLNKEDIKLIYKLIGPMAK